MARGYPEPKDAAEPTIPRLVEKGICVICKRRPAEAGRDKCATCAEALSS